MKFKRTLLKSSLTRRLLSAVLAATMVAGLLPASALAAGTASTASAASVEYTRRKPEVAIFNAYTGTSTALYKEMRTAANSHSYHSGPYDAFPALFGVLGQFLGTDGYDWKEERLGPYADSTLRELSKVYGNLEVNISATFINDKHTHTHAKKLRKYEYEIVDYEKVYLQIGPYSPVLLAGVYPKENKDAAKPMVGDYDGVSNENQSSDAKNATDSYGIVRYSNDDTTFKVNFVGMQIGYYHFGELKVCTCNHTSADFPMMTFRDSRAPQVAGVYYSLDDGQSWTPSTSGLRVKGDSTLLIKLSFDEPIRFADDDKAGKGDLYLELQADGASTGYENRRAYLTRLDGNDLYFSYTFSEQDVDWNIQTLNMSSLFGSSLPLVQVGWNGSFTLDSRFGTTGFTTTTCHITDLAGNALAARTVSSGNLKLDSEKPYVQNVQFNLAVNNAAVKEAQGKDKWDPTSDQYKKDYTDISDYYLGAGDTLSLVLNMNERLKIDTLTGYTAVATINIKDENGNPVTVASAYYLPEAERVPGDITSWVMEPITMQAGWTVDMTDNPKGEIRVTALRFEGDGTEITDLAGNALDKDHVTIATGANANPPVLDVTAPTVEAYKIVTSGEESGEEIAEKPEGTGFRYSVTISDNAQPYTGIWGSFILTNGGDGKRYKYEYAVTAEGVTTDKTVWTTAATGKAQDFMQHEHSYIHIRPVADTTYTYGDLSNCTLIVTAKDYAGNESTALDSGTLTWYIDNQAPTVKAGETTRALKSNTSEGGTLTVNITLADSKGISKWQYAWSDSKTVEPTDWTDGALTATSTSDPVTVTASAAVADKTLFSQYLWVKATDNSKSDNVATVCLGKYTYDLRGAQYSLDYTSGITDWVSMKVPTLGETDSLFFLVKGKADSAYALLRLDGSPYYRETSIFSRANPGTLIWNYSYTYAVDSNGLYTLTKADDAEVQSTLQDTIDKVKNGTYMGELDIVLLSGPQGSVTGAVGDAALTLGDGSYHFSQDTFTFKMTGVRVNNYGTITFTSDSDPGSPYRSSLAGMEFKISIAEDLNGWNYADVNWTESYVELIKNVQGEEPVSYKFYLQPGTIAKDGSTTQILTIPKDDYVNGIYYAKLHIECTAGQDYERNFTTDGSITGNSVFISVDTTEPNSDFSLTSMTYAPQELWSNKYGIGDFYGTLDCLDNTEDGVIILPVAAGDTFGTGYPGQSYQFTISSPTEIAAVSIYGRYELQMWVMGNEANKLIIDPTDDGQQTVKNNYYIDDNHNYTYSSAYGFVFDPDDVVTGKYLYLAPDQVNTVAMQKVYSNGSTSQVKYIQIKPVTQHITGTVSVDSSTDELVFTPDNPAFTVGAKIYAWAWQNEQDPRSTGTRIDMSPASDGTWRCSLVENGAMYEVITVNSAGSICDAGFIGARAPWFDELSGNLGDFGPDGIKFTDNGDGTYQLEFQVRDDYNTIQNGLKLDIGFNNDYATEHLSFTVKKGSNSWSSEDTDSCVDPAYSWTETGVSSTGLYSVEVGKYKHDQSNIQSPGIEMDAMHELDYLYVTVKGCFQNVTDPQTKMNITVTATDALGNTASVSTEEQPVNYRQLVIYGDDAADSSLKPTLGDNGLILKSNQPVRPVDSWAWREADSTDTSFQTQWEGAFPIAGNGTYTLEFVDIFGQTCTQELTITDAFTVNGKDYSMNLIFSTTDLTAATVAVTAACPNGYLTFWEGDGSGTIWKETDENGTYVYNTFELLDKEGGNYWPASSIPNPATGKPIPEDELKNFGTVLRSIRWYTNGKMLIRCGGSSYSEGNRIYGLNVYIGNIAKSAPAADVRYYVYALGEEFTQERLEQYIAANGGSVTVTGNVEVWYKTARSVTPTEGGSQYLFTPGNYTAGHTFAYADDAGNTASVFVTLPEGLTLEAPDVPPEDTTAPTVKIDIYTKISGSYTQAEAFSPGDTDITERFERLGYVQGYSLTVDASDASGYDIAVSGDGAALSGNIVTITKAGTFTITVTDRSTNSNATSVTFTVPEKIDTTPPVGDIVVTANSLYDKTLTITLTDKDDAGNDTGTVTLSLPADAVQDANDANKYTYHITDNGEVEFVFFDQAGNRGTAGETVSGIDTEPPTLSVTWSPANPDNSAFPPTRPVKTDVTARIRSDKAMWNLTVQTENGTVYPLLINGVSQPCNIYGCVTITAAPELITVTYSMDWGMLTFTATASNGKSTTLTLNGLYNVIDKYPPIIYDVTQTPLTRSGCSVPYAVKVSLWPKETVTSPNYGEMETDAEGAKRPVEYDYSTPLVLTFTENGTYNVRFVDKAGNVTIEPVEITGVDSKAPALRLGEPNVNGQTATVEVTVDEACTLKWSESGTHTFDAAGSYTINFTQNGTYAITATDAAGNESYKMLRVGSIDGIAPSISFNSSTIYVMQDSEAAALTAALNTGYTVWDNVTAEEALTVSIDSSSVNLNAAGQYTVIYTVTDAAGNVTTANRFVRVIGSDTVCLKVDGQLILPDCTAVLRPGAHTLTLENNGDEPYSIKARKGILSAGQMKYLSGSSLSFDEHGNFSVTETGYYTLQVTTQSRQTIRILLYVEQ